MLHSEDYRHGVLVFVSLILAASMMLHQVGASPSPFITIATNPVNYGQNDKITVAASPTFDYVELYINNTLVAGPNTTTVNYTVCSNNYCLPAGTYAVTAKDTSTGTYTIQNLVIKPVSPTISIQNANPTYGQADQITGNPAFYNDTTSIQINGQIVATGQDVVQYQICNATQSYSCLTPGLYNVSVFDKTEGVWSATNKTVDIKAAPVYLTVQHQVVQYGKNDTLSVSAPKNTDQVYIIVNSSTVYGASGSSISYTICNSTAQPCIAPGTYSVYAQDSSENTNSSFHSLTITPVNPELTVSNKQVAYGGEGMIYAKAPNQYDKIYLYIDGIQVLDNQSNITYITCDPLRKTVCPSAGLHSISVYDSVEGFYSNATINVTPVLPAMSVSTDRLVSGVPDLINGTAPYYADNLSVIVNGVSVATGVGTVAYTICGSLGPSSCLPPGVYNVSVDDLSEEVYSTHRSITVLASANGNGTSAPTSMLTTTMRLGSTVSTTTVAGSGKGGTAQGSGILGYIELAVGIIVVIIIIAVFLRMRNRSEPALPQN